MAGGVIVGDNGNIARMDRTTGQRILEISRRVAENFKQINWDEFGLQSGKKQSIERYPRLLKSLRWGDPDYRERVLGLVTQFADQDETLLDDFDSYLNEHFPVPSDYISDKPSARTLTFSPSVFELPDVARRTNLAAIMMPFESRYDAVYDAIKASCKTNDLVCKRADKIFETDTIIQDIFNLIFRSRLVIADLSGRNPNVMYEVGVAHTLGRTVIPISQSVSDIPFDIAHFRCIHYLNNNEGLQALQTKLTRKLKQYSPE